MGQKKQLASKADQLGIYFDMYDVDKNSALDMKEIKKMTTAIKSQVLCQTVAYQMIRLNWYFCNDDNFFPGAVP